MPRPHQLLIALLVLVAGPVNASETGVSVSATLTDQIRAWVVDQVHTDMPDATDVTVTMADPDPHDALAGCTDAPSLTLQGGQRIQRRLLVRVDCAEPTWRTHVPVTLNIMRPVVTASRHVSRGSLLGTQHLVLKPTDVTSLGQRYLADLGDVVGMEARRSLSPGTILTSGMLRAPELIERGDAVVIVASRGTLEVRMPGKALVAGALGQQISVRNNRSQRVVKGWVQAAGEIRVPM